MIGTSARVKNIGESTNKGGERMSITCTRCDGSGFLNLDQYENITGKNPDDLNENQMLEWIEKNADHDIQVCDCCGNGENWYGIPGEHYNSEDLLGNFGPYAYNGGLCECH